VVGVGISFGIQRPSAKHPGRYFHRRMAGKTAAGWPDKDPALRWNSVELTHVVDQSMTSGPDGISRGVLCRSRMCQRQLYAMPGMSELWHLSQIPSLPETLAPSALQAPGLYHDHHQSQIPPPCCAIGFKCSASDLRSRHRSSARQTKFRLETQRTRPCLPSRSRFQAPITLHSA
jgi:hypothetical protein